MEPLGQIGKRLQIIKTAISLTDDETINMQRSKLRLHKNDAQLDTILSVLDDENYAQASNLIDRYLRGPLAEQTTSSPKTKADQSDNEYTLEETTKTARNASSRSAEEAELIKKFGLFMDEANQEEEYNPISEDEMYLMAQKAADRTVPSEEEISTLPPEKPSAEEIMDQFHTIDREKIPHSDTMKRASLRHTQIQNKPIEIVQAEEEDFSYVTLGTAEKEPSKTTEEIPEEIEEIETASQNTQISNEPLDAEPMEYTPISYIDQKLRNMRNQYLQVEESSEHFESEERLLYMISLEGYSEKDIEAAIDKVFSLQKEGKLAEASHLLLICAATESLYAQFLLARELYKGNILQRDLPEAFTQINRLAMNDYPEAVCDLAQFYEYGIGIDKDKKKAYDLYQDALELGVKRANTHLTRMEEASRGILGRIFKK